VPDDRLPQCALNLCAVIANLERLITQNVRFRADPSADLRKHKQQDPSRDKKRQCTTDGMMIAGVLLKKISVRVHVPHSDPSSIARHLEDAWFRCLATLPSLFSRSYEAPHNSIALPDLVTSRA